MIEFLSLDDYNAHDLLEKQQSRREKMQTNLYKITDFSTFFAKGEDKCIQKLMLT